MARLPLYATSDLTLLIACVNVLHCVIKTFAFCGLGYALGKRVKLTRRDACHFQKRGWIEREGLLDAVSANTLHTVTLRMRIFERALARTIVT